MLRNAKHSFHQTVSVFDLYCDGSEEIKFSDKVDNINRVNNETIKKVCKEYGIGEKTYYRILREKYKALEQSNVNLKGHKAVCQKMPPIV